MFANIIFPERTGNG